MYKSKNMYMTVKERKLYTLSQQSKQTLKLYYANYQEIFCLPRFSNFRITFWIVCAIKRPVITQKSNRAVRNFSEKKFAEFHVYTVYKFLFI